MGCQTASVVKNGAMKLCQAILIVGLFFPGVPEVFSTEDLQKRAAEHSLALSEPEDLAPLLTAIGDARLVLLGEASHGTSEFYRWRADLSKRLIEEKGFRFVAVEGDWTAIAHLNRYIKDLPGGAASAREALLQIDRWPLWMWSNEEMVEFGQWLRDFNDKLPPDRKVAIYGIDIYGFWQSLDAVQSFYEEHIPGSAGEVRDLYAGFRRFYGDNAAYVRHVYALEPSAEAQLQRVAEKLQKRYEDADEKEKARIFDAWQQAKVVLFAEKHLRHSILPGPDSWNARARNFMNTVSRLLDFYGPGSRGIVWAHNTHIGDARATEMARLRQVNIGQLAREQLGEDEVFAVGFGTATGTVLAAREWEGKRELMNVPSPMPGSLEDVFSTAVDGPSLLLFEPTDQKGTGRETRIPHRAIGVIYHPERERSGNYVPTILERRYNAFIWLPETAALQPLHGE